MDNFMKGRNGADELTIVLGFFGIILAMIGSLAHFQWLSWIAIAVIVIGVLRGLSKNVDARRKENEAFVAATANVPGLGKFVASLGGGAAGGQCLARSRHQQRGPGARQAHGKEDVEGPQDHGLPQVSQLRPDALRPQGQGQDPRHLPQVPRQDGNPLLATARETN